MLANPWASWFLGLARESAYYAVPGFLYMIDNNIQYLILTYINPATMSLVWNVKIVITAVLFKCVMKKQLGRLKWTAVLLLFVGVMTTQAARVETLHIDSSVLLR